MKQKVLMEKKINMLQNYPIRIKINKGVLKWIAPLILFFFMCSCTQNIEELYITIDGYSLLNKDPELFGYNSKQEIIKFNCKTNFPKGTMVLINKGLRVNVTNKDLLNESLSIDTIRVDKNSFQVLFSPYYVGGYIRLSIVKNIQTDQINAQLKKNNTISENEIYSIEYEINYVKEKTANGINILKTPIQLDIKEL